MTGTVMTKSAYNDRQNQHCSIKQAHYTVLSNKPYINIDVIVSDNLKHAYWPAISGMVLTCNYVILAQFETKWRHFSKFRRKITLTVNRKGCGTLFKLFIFSIMFNNDIGASSVSSNSRDGYDQKTRGHFRKKKFQCFINCTHYGHLEFVHINISLSLDKKQLISSFRFTRIVTQNAPWPRIEGQGTVMTFS